MCSPRFGVRHPASRSSVLKGMDACSSLSLDGCLDERYLTYSLAMLRCSIWPGIMIGGALQIDSLIIAFKIDLERITAQPFKEAVNSRVVSRSMGTRSPTRAFPGAGPGISHLQKRAQRRTTGRFVFPRPLPFQIRHVGVPWARTRGRLMSSVVTMASVPRIGQPGCRDGIAW